MRLQEHINELFRDHSGDETRFKEEEYEETYAEIQEIICGLELLLCGQTNKIEIIHPSSPEEMFNKLIFDLDSAFGAHKTVVEEQGYYKGLRDGLKLASGFEIGQIPVVISLLEKPKIQLNITDVDKD